MQETGVRALTSAFKTLPIAAAMSILNLQPTQPPRANPSNSIPRPTHTPTRQAFSLVTAPPLRRVQDRWDSEEAASKHGADSRPVLEQPSAQSVVPTGNTAAAAAAEVATEATAAAAAAAQAVPALAVTDAAKGKEAAAVAGCGAQSTETFAAQQKLLEVLTSAASHGCRGAEMALSSWLAHTAKGGEALPELVFKV